MEVYSYEGKKEIEVLNKALTDLNVTEEEILYKKEQIKGGFLKGDATKFTIAKITDVQEELKKYLQEILSQMGLEVKFETNIRENQINIKMFSDNNAILIGKDGKTLTALSTICKQYINNIIGVYPYLNLDVENYKDKKISHLERLAKNLAREVKNTKQEIVMENMNSYERRIVHNCLTNMKGIETISEGEEPNRHVIIKPTKDDDFSK